MCVYDAEHDFQNSVFKVIGYVKYEFRLFLVLKFLLVSRRLVGGRCIWSVVGWSVVGWSGSRSSVGRWFKETR